MTQITFSCMPAGARSNLINILPVLNWAPTIGIIYIHLWGFWTYFPTLLTFCLYVMQRWDLLEGVGFRCLKRRTKLKKSVYTTYPSMERDNGFVSEVSLSFRLLVIWEILFIDLVCLVIKASKTLASNISQNSFFILSSIFPFSSCLFL